MPTANKDLNEPLVNSTNWDVPLNANTAILDAALGGTTSFNVTGIGTTPVVLTTTQYQKLILNFTGVLSANVNYRIPSGVGGQWVVRNGSTGAFTLTISSGGLGTSFEVPQGSVRTVYSDGTNIRSTNDTVGSIPSGSVAYSSGGVLTGTTGLTYNGTVLDVMATTAATNTATEVLILDSQSSGTPAAGIGTTMSFAAETGAGNTEVGMQISAITTDVTSGSEDFDFVLRLMAAGATASEIARITSTGIMTLNGGNVVAGRTATNTAVQALEYAGITTTADDDGTFTTGQTYTPTPVGGNMKRIINNASPGGMTIAVPTAAGDYTIIVQITNSSTAGAITLSGFSRVVGNPFTTTNGSDFFVYITKCNGFTLANVVALQ
jgi:hypothetical protein